MQRLILPFALLAAVFGIGIGWYSLVEDFRLLDERAPAGHHAVDGWFL